MYFQRNWKTEIQNIKKIYANERQDFINTRKSEEDKAIELLTNNLGNFTMDHLRLFLQFCTKEYIPSNIWLMIFSEALRIITRQHVPKFERGYNYLMYQEILNEEFRKKFNFKP